MNDLNDFQLSIDLLKILFPDVFCGDKIDFLKLRAHLMPFLDKNGEIPALNWNEKNFFNKEKKCSFYFSSVSKNAVLFGERHAFICGQTLNTLYLLQKTHTEKIRLVFADIPSPSEETLKKSPESLTRCLNVIYPVLCAVKPLLHKNACLFLFANNVLSPYIKILCDEIFGLNAFCTSFIWQRKSATQNSIKANINTMTQNILCYQKGQNILIGRTVTQTKNRYPFYDEIGRFRLKNIEKKNNDIYERTSMRFPILGHLPSQGKRWCFGKKIAEELEKKERFVFSEKTVKQKVYDFEEKQKILPVSNLLLDQETAVDGSKELNDLIGVSIAKTSKPISLFKTLIQYVPNDKINNTVLDVFAGTGSCAQAILELNTENTDKWRFIGIQKPEASLTKGFKTVCDIAQARFFKIQEKLHLSCEEAIDFFTLEHK